MNSQLAASSALGFQAGALPGEVPLASESCPAPGASLALVPVPALDLPHRASHGSTPQFMPAGSLGPGNTSRGPVGSSPADTARAEGVRAPAEPSAGRRERVATSGREAARSIWVNSICRRLSGTRTRASALSEQSKPLPTQEFRAFADVLSVHSPVCFLLIVYTSSEPAVLLSSLSP